MPPPKTRAARAINVANVLSTARMALIPFFVIALLDQRTWTALALFAVAGVTDALDGAIARRYSMQTHFGAYLDPLADKILTTTGYLLLALPLGFPNRIPVWLTVLVVGRDVMIAASALIMYLAAGITKFPVTAAGKIHTGVQTATIGLFLLHNGLGRSSPLLTAATVATLLTTLVTGCHYLYRSARTVSATQPPAG